MVSEKKIEIQELFRLNQNFFYPFWANLVQKFKTVQETYNPGQNILVLRCVSVQV